jgi:hypothetical protein
MFLLRAQKNIRRVSEIVPSLVVSNELCADNERTRLREAKDRVISTHRVARRAKN